VFTEGGVGNLLRPLNDALHESALFCHGDGAGAAAVFASLCARMLTPSPFDRRRARFADILQCPTRATLATVRC